MNFFRTIYNFCITPNTIFSIISLLIFMGFFHFLIFYFFKPNKNQVNYKLKTFLFITLNTCISVFSTIFLNSIFSGILIILFTTVSFSILFNALFKKVIIYSSVFSFIYFNLITILLICFFKYLNYNYNFLIRIPLFCIDLSICYFISLIITYLITIKLIKTDLEIENSFKDTAEICFVFFLNLILMFNFLEILYNYNTNNYNKILLLLFFLLDFYFCMSISNIIKIIFLENANQTISNLELYNKSVSTAYDETRAFKHDSNNIFQAIGGYISSENFNGLKEYYWQVFPEIKNINNLSKLNPELINNPAIYSMLSEKLYKAVKDNVDINLDILIDLNSLNVKIFEFTRILGILVDNAIETARICPKKIVNICFKKDNNKQLLIIENTYNNKDISLDKIFEKGFSTKPKNTGLGLWEVRKILKKSSNLNLYTSKSDDYFMQQLEIY